MKKSLILTLVLFCLICLLCACDFEDVETEQSDERVSSDNDEIIENIETKYSKFEFDTFFGDISEVSGKEQYDSIMNDILNIDGITGMQLYLYYDESAYEVDSEYILSKLDALPNRGIYDGSDDLGRYVQVSLRNPMSADDIEALAEYEWATHIKIKVEPSPEKITLYYIMQSDMEPDRYVVDYGKFKILNDVVNIEREYELSCRYSKDVVEMIEEIEKNGEEPLRILNQNEGIEMLQRLVEASEGSEFALMVRVNYSWKPQSYVNSYGLTFVDARFTENYTLRFDGYSESSSVLIYTKEQILDFGYENLMKALEKYTKYSHVESIVISPAPVVDWQ